MGQLEIEVRQASWAQNRFAERLQKFGFKIVKLKGEHVGLRSPEGRFIRQEDIISTARGILPGHEQALVDNERGIAAQRPGFDRDAGKLVGKGFINVQDLGGTKMATIVDSRGRERTIETSLPRLRPGSTGTSSIPQTTGRPAKVAGVPSLEQRQESQATQAANASEVVAALMGTPAQRMGISARSNGGPPTGIVSVQQPTGQFEQQGVNPSNILRNPQSPGSPLGSAGVGGASSLGRNIGVMIALLAGVLLVGFLIQRK